ncbi:unnamed protein product [Agarophyton chilense]
MPPATVSAASAPRSRYSLEKLLSLRHNRQLPAHVTRIRCAAFLASVPTAPTAANPPIRRASPPPPPSPPPGFGHVHLALQPSPPRSPSRSPSPPSEDRARVRIARAPYMPDNFATRIAFHSRPAPFASPLTSQEIDALFDTSSSPFDSSTDRPPDSNSAVNGLARFTHFREIESRNQLAPSAQVIEPSKNPQPPDDQLEDSVLAFFELVRARARNDDPEDSSVVQETVSRDADVVPNTLTNAQKVAPAQINQSTKSDVIDLQNWFARLAQQTMQ